MLYQDHSCGYELDSFSAPFTALFVTWTVPDLRFTPNPPFGPDPNLFRTFVTLGSIQGGLDAHVEMTVDSANTVTSQLWVEFVGNVNLPISPGDVISGSLCLNAQPPGAGAYFFVNETRGQTMSFPVTTGLPLPRSSSPVSRARVTSSSCLSPRWPSSGVIYFDEISAYTTSGPQTLTSGDAVTMTDQNGTVLATPERLNDWAFKVVRA